MIITLKGANFSGNNIGTLDMWFITLDIKGVTSSNTATSVKKGEAWSTTFTIKDGYTIDENSTFTVDGVTQALTWSSAEAGGTATFSFTPSKNTSIVLKATSTGSSGGEEEPDGPSPVVYTSRKDSSGISKTTGEYLSSSTGYVNIYENIDTLKAYAVTSYAPASTSDNACVCYYTSDGTFISAESGSDWGISSTEYTMVQLTVPTNASTIKLFGRTNNQEAVLYLLPGNAMDEINYSSQQTASNLNKTTGEYGSSTTGYVNIYDNIDVNKTYYGSGFAPNATGSAAAVCYYTSDGTFISAQDGNDFGVSSASFVKQKLTVPSTTYTIKIFAQDKSAYPTAASAALYVER